jgi:transposase
VCSRNVSQLACWAGVCPGTNESAGKRKSSRIPKGNAYLKTTLIETKARRAYKRAAVTIAHKILVAIYQMFSHRVCYKELGDLYLDKLNKHHLTRNLVHRLERLGYIVKLEQNPL